MSYSTSLLPKLREGRPPVARNQEGRVPGRARQPGLAVHLCHAGDASVCAFYALFSVVILATWRTSSWLGVDGPVMGHL
jgi:hypothetical protein